MANENVNESANENLEWFRQVGPEDAVAPVDLARLRSMIEQLGWEVTAEEGSEYPITASRDGRDIEIWSVNNGNFLELNHVGSARFSGEIVGEFAGQLNTFNGDPDIPHVVRLLPAYDDEARVCVRASSTVFIGEGMSDVQLREYLQPTLAACTELVEGFERGQEPQANV
ncbi:hypothetical protein [Actinobaculum sp. 313]|uniref:hypothetical protein n=1 Tax=Actinobaculum sp. 313 TaxID=2495645 RepID=UPI000D52783D|nr:hypothetical protein [Actinobaculum sp. 313]AWE42843.1 hypothetical protein DDD63_08930 [Actinobaculum sp. 313]